MSLLLIINAPPFSNLDLMFLGVGPRLQLEQEVFNDQCEIMILTLLRLEDEDTKERQMVMFES